MMFWINNFDNVNLEYLVLIGTERYLTENLLATIDKPYGLVYVGF